MKIQDLYPNCETLFNFLRENQSYFTGCCECNKIWLVECRIMDIPQKKITALALAALYCNQQALTQKDLADRGIFIDFGQICPRCYAVSGLIDVIRQSQVDQSYDACFCAGRKNCNQADCSMRHVCMQSAKENPLPITEESTAAYLAFLQQNIRPSNSAMH